MEARPSTLGQSQSVMNISRMSPKVEPKKRRAPAPPGPTPTPHLQHHSLDTYQVSQPLPAATPSNRRQSPFLF